MNETREDGHVGTLDVGGGGEGDGEGSRSPGGDGHEGLVERDRSRAVDQESRSKVGLRSLLRTWCKWSGHVFRTEDSQDGRTCPKVRAAAAGRCEILYETADEPKLVMVTEPEVTA